ncbi:hypothetical protein [Streptomyces sp. NPDC020983]
MSADDGWLSDAAHEVLQEQTQQHLASATDAGEKAEAAHELAEQIRNGS